MNTASTDALDVFGVVFAEGSSKPSFQGTTKLFLDSKAKVMSAIKKSFPEARKVCMSVLGVPTHHLPKWFRECGGKLYFPASLRMRFTPSKPPVAPEVQAEEPAPKARRHSKKSAPKQKAAKQKVKARKTVRSLKSRTAKR